VVHSSIRVGGRYMNEEGCPTPYPGFQDWYPREFAVSYVPEVGPGPGSGCYDRAYVVVATHTYRLAQVMLADK
jgi:hypothetical protein